MDPILVHHLAAAAASDEKAAKWASGGGDGKSTTGAASSSANVGAVGSIMNINFRRTYALAPCHHLFHTECLNHWMAIKVSQV